MPRGNLNITPADNFLPNVLFSHTGTAGTLKEYWLNNGSISYYSTNINQSFSYILLDNIGTGQVRINYNRPGLSLVSSIDGAKSLRAGDTIYIEENIWYVSIYFIEDSIVEIILKAIKYE